MPKAKKPEPKPSIKVGVPLSNREMQVAKMLAVGATNQEIADTLEISVKTIDTHRHNTLVKCGIRNNAELARHALENGWTDLAVFTDQTKELRDALKEALDLVEESNGDPSSCNYNVPIGDRAIELRKIADKPVV